MFIHTIISFPSRKFYKNWRDLRRIRAKISFKLIQYILNICSYTIILFPSRKFYKNWRDLRENKSENIVQVNSIYIKYMFTHNNFVSIAKILELLEGLTRE